MMRIYGASASPFVQRVLMAARLKGHDLPVEPPPGGGAQSPEFRAISPLGRIPVLDDDGWTVPESGAIVGYLDEVLDGPLLYPADARAAARVRVIESLGIGELGGLRPIMTGPVFGMATDPAIVAAARTQVANGLAAIESVRDGADQFAIGAAPSAADCLLAPILTLIEIIDPLAQTLALLAPNTGLAAYRERADAHDIIGRSCREMREGFAAILARRRA